MFLKGVQRGKQKRRGEERGDGVCRREREQAAKPFFFAAKQGEREDGFVCGAKIKKPETLRHPGLRARKKEAQEHEREKPKTRGEAKKKTAFVYKKARRKGGGMVY